MKPRMLLQKLGAPHGGRLVLQAGQRGASHRPHRVSRCERPQGCLWGVSGHSEARERLSALLMYT